MGDKPNISMEQHVMARNPELGGALAVDTQGLQTALLIEPVEANSSPLTTNEQAALIEKVWPNIKEANSTTTAQARIDKALILVTTPDRPLLRDSKGSVQRAISADQYAAELDVLRANAGFGPGGGEVDPDSIGQFVQESVSAVTGWPHEDAEHHRPRGTFFDRGMDSPVALQLARVLRRGLRRGDVGLSTVYCHPTVEQLTAAIVAAVGK